MGDKMDYRTFQEEIKNLAEEGFREKGDYAISWHTAHKNNISRRGLTISEQGKEAGITVYLDQYYQEYLQGKALSKICGELVSLYREKQPLDITASELTDYGKMKGKLRIRLAGREQNAAYLEEGPYQIHPVGAEVVYAELARTEEGTLGMRVTHQILKQWGIPEQELFETALENCQKEEGVRFGTIMSEVEEITGMEMPEDDPIDKSGLYVLSNQSRNYGAVVLLYPGVLEEVYRKMEGDFYILPSSVHEVLILSKEAEFTPAELKRIVMEVNREQVAPEERLGNDVYEFQGKTGTLQKCKIAEKQMAR